MGSYLQNSLTNLLELFTSQSNRHATNTGDFDIAQMTEHVVDIVDPKIRVIGRYIQKLNTPITNTWNYINDIASSIPGGIEFSKPAYINDPRTRLVVGSQDEMNRLVDNAIALLDKKPDQFAKLAGQMYMLLCMELKKHSFLGAELSGEIIKREVQQTSVKFINRKVLSSGLTEKAARTGFKNCAIEGLLHKIQHDILQHNQDYKSLIQQKTSLRRKLQNTGQGNISDMNPEMREIEKQLADTRFKSASPDQHLASTIDVLNHPEQYLDVNRKSIALNKLGIKQEGKAQEGSIIIDYAEIEVEQSLKRIAMIVNTAADHASSHSIN